MEKSTKCIDKEINFFGLGVFFGTLSLIFKTLRKCDFSRRVYFVNRKKIVNLNLPSVNTTISRIFHTKNDRNTKTIER